MPCVSRVDSYSHVRDCGSYQPRIEGSWPSGMYGVPQFGWEWTSIGTSIWATNVPQLSQDDNNWALTLPMPTQSGVRKWEVFSVGATRTHCSPLFWGKRGRSPWAPLVAERRRDPLN